MRRFFRRRRPFLGKYVAPVDPRPATIEELVDEGVLIAAAAVRLAVKNLMIIKTVRDGLDYDEDRYEHAVREELENLAIEKELDAQRLRAMLSTASTRTGRPMHHADYRAVDAEPLHRRELVSLQLAARLRELAHDPEWVAALVSEARSAALDELAASAAAQLRSAPKSDDAEYQRQRPHRLRELADDILMLQVTPPEDR